MARGRLLRTKVKELKSLTKARLEGIRKFYKSHPGEWFSHQFPTLLNNIDKITEFIAVLGMTVVVKKVVETTPELLREAHSITLPALPALSYLLGPFATVPVFMGIGLTETPKESIGKLFPDWSLWLLSFCLAYIIVHYFGDIMRGMGEGVGAVKTLVSGLLLGSVG